MLLKIMGWMDFLFVITLTLIHFNIMSLNFFLSFAMYLIVKGIIFKGDFASLLDLICGIYFILEFLGLKTFIFYFVVVYMIQKSILSTI